MSRKEKTVENIGEFNQKIHQTNFKLIELIDEEESQIYNENFEKLLNPALFEHVKYKWRNSINTVENINFKKIKNPECLLEDKKIGISNFFILKQIGKGAFGKVFLVELFFLFFFIIIKKAII